MNHRKTTVQANYDRLSRWYDLLSGSHEQSVRARALELLALRPGERVLEVGAGTGQAIADMHRSVGPDGMVSGVDISMGMLVQAKRNCAGNAGLIQADAAHLPLASASQKAVLACFTLEIFPASEVPAVLSEWMRVLEPSGRLCTAAMSASLRPNGMERLYAWSARVLPDVVDCRPVDATALLEEGGFSILRAERTAIWGLPVQIVLAGRS